MTIKVSRRFKSTREAVDDIDYARKLGPEDAAWLETFMRATAANSVDDMATLVNGDIRKLAKLQREIFAEDNAKRRDITYVGQRIDMTDSMDGDQTASLADDINFDPVVRCRRCLRRECDCGPRFQVRIQQYDQLDYIPKEHTEDVALNELDLARRMEAFDLLPYGDAPKGLEQGHAVKVCLPHHLLDKAAGVVLEFRPVAGDYLVRSLSKHGLRDKDGTRPKATLLYVKPSGLKRIRPELVKAICTSADKTNATKNGGAA